MRKPTRKPTKKRTGKHPRHGWTCQRCRSLTARTITVENAGTGERMAICSRCISEIINAIRPSAATQIKRAIVEQSKPTSTRRK